MSRQSIVLLSLCFALIGVIILSYAAEKIEFEIFREIACADGLRDCAPTGNRVLVKRDHAKRELKLEFLGDNGTTTGFERYIECEFADHRTFFCRRQFGIGSDAGDSSTALAPWRMVQGQLIGPSPPSRARYFVDPPEYWRRRLLGGFDK